MNRYVHTCPYCFKHFLVSEIEEETVASHCPSCQNIVLLTNHGQNIKKPYVVLCPKCKDKHIYDSRPQLFRCDGCGTIAATAPYGSSALDIESLGKGDKGEIPYTKKPDKYIALRNKWRRVPKKTKALMATIFCLLIACCIGLYIYSLPKPINTTLAYQSMDSIWNDFRTKYPYNIQIEGIQAFEDNSYVMIVSEPSQETSEDDLHKFFKKYNCEFRTHQKKIGYDGYLRDAIIAFNDITPKKLPQMAKDLSNLLYGTDYKADFLDLEMLPEHTAFSDSDLNYSITAEELRQWLIDDKEQLMALEDSTKITDLPSVLSDASKGQELYISKEPGFVIWTMNTGNVEENDLRIAARKFSLDTDLVLGAIATDTKVAIIGRERVLPVYVLPPMRAETLCLLANTEDNELAQSYERNHMFAGKMPGGKDYAPILLSDELWHTEYGNILNVTDQMLKSWSENGMIDYVDFDYPKPVYWAFDEGAVQDLGSTSLTYNWNTAGVGYIVADDDYSVYALNRTGSLPVSYIPGDATETKENDPVYQAEQKAYDFFSNLSSPELAKVVQYAAMYQIFRNLDVHMLYLNRPYYEHLKMVLPDEIKNIANSTIRQLANFDVNGMDRIAKDYNPTFSVKKNQDGLSINENYSVDGDVNDIDDIFMLLSCRSFLQKLDTLSTIVRSVSFDETLMSDLGAYIIDPYGTNLKYDPYSKTKKDIHNTALGSLQNRFPNSNFQRIVPTFNDFEDNIWFVIENLMSNQKELQKFLQKSTDLTTDQFRDYFVEANAERSHTWMKCPTIVESWQLVDSVNWEGGHNLDAKITRFKVSKDLKPGQTRKVTVNGKDIIEVSPYDSRARIADQGYLRKVGRLDDIHLSNKEVTVRPRSTVTASAPKRTARGFNKTDHTIPVRVGERGFELNGKRYDNLTEFLDDFSNMKVDKNAQTLKLELDCLNGSPSDVNVSLMDNISCAMRRGGASNLPMSRFDFSHHTVTFQGDKAIVTIPLKSGEFQFGSSSSVTRAGFGGVTEAAPKFHMNSGKMSLEVPKTKLNAFLSALKKFFQNTKGYFNEFKFMQLLKEYGIVKTECQGTVQMDLEALHLKVAQIRTRKNYVQSIQKENLA